MNREVEEVKSKIDIIDVVSEYVKLTPAGANHKGNCPFHNEKTPSFMVNKDKQIWRCFGCGEGGDALSFLMKAEGIGFVEALKIMAERAGVQLKNFQFSQEKNSKSERLHKLLDLCSKYFNKILLESGKAKIAIDYLQNRKISSESIENFKIGYSIDEWDNLILFLKKRKFTDKEIFLAGLSIQRKNGGFYDRFRGRIMFPISDVHGRVVGFGARTLNADDQAKYINSPQGEVYNKSAVLYGLNVAKNYIKKENSCIMVEGYMDVIPSHQMGIKNVVSISGTALTQEQITLVKRFTHNISLALDKDLAGQNAAERSADLALQNGMNVYVIQIPEGKDPGESATNNPEAWRQAVKKAIPAMDYFLERICLERDLSKTENKKIIAEYFLEKIANLPSKIDQEFWIKKLADKIGTSVAILWEMLPGKKSTIVNKDEVNSKLIIKENNKNYNLLLRMLSIIYQSPKLAKNAFEDLPAEIFEGKTERLYKKLVMYYTKNITKFNGVSENSAEIDLFDSFKRYISENGHDSELESFCEESFLMSQNKDENVTEKDLQEEFAGLIKILKADYINFQINALKTQLEKAENKSDRQQIEEIYSKINQLIKRKALLE